MNWPTLTVDPLSPHQVARLTLATGRHLGILGGSPGTGKTFTAAQIISALGNEIGFDQIAAAAPTGKAAVRLSEAMNSYGIPLVARTIHSLLVVESQEGNGGWSFKHNRMEPLPFKVLVIDESSMIDTDLMASLMAARAKDCLVLFIGDVQQLPPVGHGAPLRDMIAAGVPYGELTEIKRQQSGSDRVHAVVQACADIRDGRQFSCGEELRHVAAFTPESQIAWMTDTIDSASRSMKIHPVWDVQVLCAVNKKSELSRKELNKVLQAQLNPNQPQHGSPFRVADKVVNTKNGWFPLVEIAGKSASGGVILADNDPNLQLNSDGKVYVANGELGEVMEVHANFMHVRLTAPKRLIVVPRGAADVNDDGGDEESTGTGCNWDLGYALSVHKFQGSEVAVAIVIIDDSSAAKRVCDRSWIYTAISRAKGVCYLIGNLSVAQGFCKRQTIASRKTFLKERIQQCLSDQRS